MEVAEVTSSTEVGYLESFARMLEAIFTTFPSMVSLGWLSLALALIASLGSIFCLFLATRKTLNQGRALNTKAQDSLPLEQIQFAGLVLVWAATAALTICCVILVIAFFNGDNSISYVAKYRSHNASSLAPLFKFSGLWAGRGGSLLFWAWLIGVFSSIVAFRTWRSTSPSAKISDSLNLLSGAKSIGGEEKSPAKNRALDSAAIAITQCVLLIFIVILVFDEANMPFIPIDPRLLDFAGNLTGNAALWGMNALLEHWAMAFHPPTLFVGYAGLTIPFAYAIAALVVNDPSKTWVNRAHRYTLFSWLFLGIGIGIGAVWAYVVLGWGGYWGWDPVENASLLSWGAGVALVHTMTIYKQRGTMKRWAIMLACLTFAFVIVGTFITRSGIVESVHAFEENQLAMLLFGILILVPMIVGTVMLIIRRNTFKDAPTHEGEAESFMSKDVAYYLNNVVMVVCMLFLMYMTLSSALPSWLPFGGQALKAPAFDAIARPIGVLYVFVLAACPLLAWRKTSFKSFFKQAWMPAIFAGVLFVLLLFYYVDTLLPTYMHILAANDKNSQILMESGPFFYYALLTLLGFLAASLLFFNALVMLVRAIKKRNLRVQTIGGFLAHMSIGILMIGLIGSSMYSYEKIGEIAGPNQPPAGMHGHGHAASQAEETFKIKNYELKYVSRNMMMSPNGNDVHYTIILAVEKDGVPIGQVKPQIQYVQSTGQQMLHAGIISFPTEDLFVVYWGDSEFGEISLDVRVNPLILFVWIGFGLLMVGTAIAALGRRDKRKASEKVSESPKKVLTRSSEAIHS
ncbi:MAG: cytochrome c biogenesis protein CcsA [Coriobacteriia bacterium]|nr:cytochrome c biogenesis protein CcsA [Coriobacteriia bacterium]